jgi:hypothetical protein
MAIAEGPSRRSLGREDIYFYAIAIAAVLSLTSVNAVSVAHDAARIGRHLALWEPFVWELSSGLALLAVLPVIMWITLRAWPRRPPPFGWIAVQIATAFGGSLIHVILMGVIRWAVYAAVGRHYDALAPLADWPYELRKDLVVYTGVVAFYIGWRMLRSPARSPVAPDGEGQVLEVRDGARRHFVPLADVVWVEAAGNYVELHRGGEGILHRASLSEMQRRLERTGFVRIHRSRLVRREAVLAVESKPTGDFVVRLRDGRELAGSRRYRRPLLAD